MSWSSTYRHKKFMLKEKYEDKGFHDFSLVFSCRKRGWGGGGKRSN